MGHPPNLFGAEMQILLGNADQKEGVQLFEVLGAQGQALHAGEVQLHCLLQERDGLLLWLLLLRCHKGLQKDQYLWKRGLGPGAEAGRGVRSRGWPEQCGLPLGSPSAGDSIGKPSLPISSDLRLPEGLLHLLEELQLVRRLLQLALQDLAPDAPCRWDKNEAEQAAEPAAGQIQGQTETGK